MNGAETATSLIRRKPRHDLVRRMYSAGRLRPEHVAAADDIRLVWQAFARALGPSSADPRLLALPRRRDRGQRRDIGIFSDREEIAWRNRYRPWAAEAALTACGRAGGSTRFRLVFDAVVENRPLRDIERSYRLRNGVAGAHLREGLHRYAEIAGWLDMENYRI